MKIFCHIPRENWFCDRYGKEYSEYSENNISHQDTDSDIIWLLAAWCWNQIPYEVLKNKKVVCTIHHEVPWKFDQERYENFMIRDSIVDAYHVPCDQTKSFVEKITSKPVYKIGYWCNNSLWKPSNKKDYYKNLFNLPKDNLVVSSFQRDTEGSDLVTPKLEKGPDIFCEAVGKLSKERDVHVLLNGWRRQYVISELKKRNIPYTYYELPKIEDVAKMYLATDLYMVCSRVEGGPQSLSECAASKIPIISSDMGMSRDILDNECITNDFSNVSGLIDRSISSIDNNFRNVEKFFIKSHVKKYDSMFKKIAGE